MYWKCNPLHTRGHRPKPIHFSDARGDFALVRLSSGPHAGSHALVTSGLNKTAHDATTGDFRFWQMVDLTGEGLWAERVIVIST